MRKAIALLLGLVAILAAAGAWLQRPDHITAREAVRAATGAFEAAGLQDASVNLRVEADTYDAPGQPPVRVWKTSARLEDGTVELWLSRKDGEPVFLDDRSGDGTEQLLTDDQFRKIGDHYENPALSRQIRRNLLATLAAAVIVALLVRLALIAPPPRVRRRRRSRESR